MTTQPDLFSPPAEVQAAEIPESDLCNFRAHLISAGTWQTRAQITEALGWSDRYIREVAEALGGEVVRGQRGFLLFNQLPDEEMHCAIQAANAAASQSSKQAAYSLALRKRIHARIG